MMETSINCGDIIDSAMLSLEAVETAGVIDFAQLKKTVWSKHYSSRLRQAHNNQAAFLNLIQPVFQAIENHPDSHQESYENPLGLELISKPDQSLT